MRLCLLALTLLVVKPLMAEEPAPATDNIINASFQQPAPGSLIVLLPAKSGRAYLAKGEEYLMLQLNAQLKAAGYQVAALNAENFQDLWADAVDAQGGLYDPLTGQLRTDAYANTLAAVVKKVAASTHCALVLSPYLVQRHAKLLGRRAEWDSQRRRALYHGAFDTMEFSGGTYGLSAELSVFNADGSLAYKYYGGTSLPFTVDIEKTKTQWRTDLFDSDVETAQGVKIVLSPLLTTR